MKMEISVERWATKRGSRTKSKESTIFKKERMNSCRFPAVKNTGKNPLLGYSWWDDRDKLIFMLCSCFYIFLLFSHTRIVRFSTRRPPSSLRSLVCYSAQRRNVTWRSQTQKGAKRRHTNMKRRGFSYSHTSLLYENVICENVPTL